MTSDLKEAYVWIWLPDETKPVVAGLLTQIRDQLHFNYGATYLKRANAIAIYAPELPLQPGEIPLRNGLSMPGCIRDASPDAWGRRVLLNHRMGRKGADAATEELGELTYLLESGSDRIGALDFQASATQYVPRGGGQASLAELMRSAERVEQGIPLHPDVDKALQHGSSIGGARPKALITEGNTKFIAKFSLSSDYYSVVKAEFLAMRLAHLAGLRVAPVRLERVLGRDVLLVERFDRERAGAIEDGWRRRSIVSALTLLELDEMMARYASYEKLAEVVRLRFTDPVATLRELYGRLVFNILCSNTDDHARNHAAFWNGEDLTLTPAYDICPQARTGQEASQAMLVHGNRKMSQLDLCLQAAPDFLLDDAAAIEIMRHLIQTIRTHWTTVCDEAELQPVDQQFFWRRQFLNPYAFYGAPEAVTRDLDLTLG